MKNKQQLESNIVMIGYFQIANLLFQFCLFTIVLMDNVYSQTPVIIVISTQRDRD